MRHLLKPVILFLFPRLSKVLIFLFIVIVTITTLKFYNITGINYLILFAIILFAILLEKAYSKLLKNIYAKVFVLIIFAAAYIRYLWQLGFNNFEKAESFLRDINAKIYFGQNIEFYYILPLIVFFLGVAAFTWARLDTLNKGNYFLTIQFFILCNISYYTEKYDVFLYVSILIFICYMCINIYSAIKINAKKQKASVKLNLSKIIIYYCFAIAVVFLFAICLIHITGNKSAAEARQAMKNKLLNNVMNNSSKLYNFSEEVNSNKWKLGGPLSINDNILFRVESDKPYYLRGNIKDNYDGTSWSKTSYSFYVSDSPTGKLLDKKLQNLLLGTKEDSDFVEPKKMTVYNESLDSSSLFTPINTVLVSSNKKNIASNSDNLFMFLDNNFEFDYYNVSYFESSAGFDDFNSFYQNKFKLDYSPLQNIAEGTPYEKVREKYSKYLQLSASITDRTKKLEKNICKDSEDIEEKIAHIKDYLRNSFPYSLNVSKVPDNRDFIDYFLFDEKKGYCTYFATTAVMFCRMEGIPARYVEGFAMDDTKDSDGLYAVKGHTAHAWCEILVSAEHDLWAKLECTPTIPRTGVNNIEKGNGHITMLKSKNKENIDLKIYRHSKQNSTDNIKTISLSISKVILYILSIFLLLVMLFISTMLVVRKLQHMKYVKVILSNKKINQLYYYVKARLLCIGIDNSNSLSEFEYMQNIQEEQLKVYLEEIVNVYEQEYYGDKDSSTIYDKKVMYKNIEKYIRKRQNILRYIIDKYKISINTNLWNNKSKDRI